MSIKERALSEVLRLDIDDDILQPDREYRIAGVYGFGRGLFRRGPIQSNETSYPKLNRLTAGHLVMSKLKAFEGAITIIPPEFDGWYLSSEFPTFAVDPETADERYVANLCMWPELWKRLGAQSKGVGARKVRVNAERLLAIKVPMPGLDEQRRIAARLDLAKFSIDALKVKRQHAAGLRDSFRESVFKCEQQIILTRLGDILTLERTPAQPTQTDYYVQIGVRSFGNGIFHRDKALGSELGKLRYFKVQPDRLVVSNIMAWEGAVAVSSNDDKDCIASNRFLTYRRSGEADLRYLNYYFQCEGGRAAIRSTSTGTVTRNQTLSIDDFENLKVPLPNIQQQERVSDWLDSIASLRNSAARQQEFTYLFNHSLLNAAFSGEL